ncbi:RHS repeat domain-containing protein [Fibrobacterota bacterium]
MTKEVSLSNYFATVPKYGAPNGGEIYIDDIRFYPEDALVNSYYYDQELGVPVTFVNANNKVHRYEYDKFGRLVKIFNNAGDLVKKAEYHMEQSRIRIIEPFGNHGYCNGEPLPIKWEAIGTYPVNIEFSYNNGVDWMLLTPQPVQTVNPYCGYGEYFWDIPDVIVSNECFVKIKYEDPTLPSDWEAFSGKFVIVAGQIRVKKPDAGEIYWIWGNNPIEWEYCGAAMDEVTVEYSFNGGTTWYPIAENVGS